MITMPDYVYTAQSVLGIETSGRITADSKREALDALHRLNLFPINVEDSRKGDITLPSFHRRISEIQIAAALIQLADLLENGVPVLQAFLVLEKQTPHPRLKSVLRNIQERIAEGESIDSAFAVHSQVFNALTINILRAGAEGAFLEESLRRVGNFLEQQAELKGKIFSALIYPMVLAVVGILSVAGLLLIFVPQFQPIFNEMAAQGQPLPIVTRSLFLIRDTILAYGLYLAVGVFVLFFIVRGQLRTSWGIRVWDRLKLRIPFLGGIMLDGAVSRFCRVLGTLLQNGVPILKSLEISGQSTGNTVLGDAVRRSAENVSGGATLSKPLAESGIIPPQTMAVISVAEESNTLEHVLLNAADSIERRSSRQLDIAVRLLEPIMLLCIGSAVFYIIVSLLLPIFQMWDSFSM